MKLSQRRGRGDEWLITFADLMTLLFCFFVLLTTLSTQPKDCSGIGDYITQNSDQFTNYQLRSNKLQCILSLPSDFLFLSGRADLKQGAKTKLKKLFQIIKEKHPDDLILVEGHTDNVPIRTKRFPSNWELSSMRAINMAHFMVKQLKFNHQSISIVSLADTRPKAKYKNELGDPLKGQQLKEARRVNRRVEIILEKKPESRELSNLLFDGKSLN